MRRARRRTASGSTERRYGSRQTNVYMARKERVCELRFQDRRRKTFAWKTKTTPIRALKRRKLVDMVVILKEGRSVRETWSGVWPLFEARSSMGMTCCRSLPQMSACESQGKQRKADFSSRRSCRLLPASTVLPCTFRTFSFAWAACWRSRSRLLSGCVPSSCSASETSSKGARFTTGRGSSRLTKASAVNSSISANA